MGEWKSGICGCFDNIGLCIFTYILPCWTFGKTAEAVGDDCLLCGIALFVPLVDIVALVTTRQKVRENKGIEGSIIGDLLCFCCCSICALMQMAQEMEVVSPLGAGESIARS